MNFEARAAIDTVEIDATQVSSKKILKRFHLLTATFHLVILVLKHSKPRVSIVNF